MRLIIIILLLILASTQARGGRDVSVHFTNAIPSSVTHRTVKSILELDDDLKFNMFKLGYAYNTYNVVFTYSNVPNGKVAGSAQPGLAFCKITIYPNAVEFDLIKTVIWHELGHCIGLDHNGRIGHIMSEQVNPFDTYSKEEIDLFLTEVRKARGVQ
jgi:hypothetical protein